MRSVCRSHSGDVLDICYNLSGPKSRSRVSRCVNPLWIQIVRIRNGGTTLSTLTFSEASYRRGTTYRREPDSVVAKDRSIGDLLRSKLCIRRRELRAIRCTSIGRKGKARGERAGLRQQRRRGRFHTSGPGKGLHGLDSHSGISVAAVVDVHECRPLVLTVHTRIPDSLSFTSDDPARTKFARFHLGCAADRDTSIASVTSLSQSRS